MTEKTLAHFQQAAVDHIVARLRDASGSRRMLLADEVGLGKTEVARGVIRALCRGRRRPLKVIYLCSNAEIAEQNRTKLDPGSKRSFERVTQLALEKSGAADGRLLLYSFTPGTSLSGGTGLKWERQLLMYLLHRVCQAEVWRKRWRDFFRCGAGDLWDQEASWERLQGQFASQTSARLQTALKVGWRALLFEGRPAIDVLWEFVDAFRRDGEPSDVARRNSLVADLRGVMQRAALRTLEPDLVILDEVQKFRSVLDDAEKAEHIASDLFAGRVPVLVLSATPYPALTLGHEIAGGATSHYTEFFDTIRFLLKGDKSADRSLSSIRAGLEQFGERIRTASRADAMDFDLLELKRSVEDRLRRVVCRTERNWYVLDRRKGIEDQCYGGELPGRAELGEYFQLQRALLSVPGSGQITEFWKSAPSMLTFIDSQYQIFRELKKSGTKVPRALVTAPHAVRDLAARHQRISKLADVALGTEGAEPCLWTAPTYQYYQDQYFGAEPARKVLVFSGWRFVPKTVAIITSRMAAERLGGHPLDVTQPVRFTDKWSFHVFDLCLPLPSLSRAGDEAFTMVRQQPTRTAEDVLNACERILRRDLGIAGVAIVDAGGDRAWQVAMRLEQRTSGSGAIIAALEACRSQMETGTGDHLERHLAEVKRWLADASGPVRCSEARLRRLALTAAFSPALSVLRACESVYGATPSKTALADIAALCMGPLRRYLNRPLVQQVIRSHRFRLPWRQLPSEDRGYVERALVFAADAHFQAVIDEYIYLLCHAGTCDTVEKAVRQLGDVWTLARGNPRTNGVRGAGRTVHVEENEQSHSTHFALAFGEDVARESGPAADDCKMRKSIVREAFNSPFWPFVLATTSVGQEGLDFHLYCRDILHWNLPSNPVDLEQREGRINRRDCLSVRQSIAKDWLLDSVLASPTSGPVKRNPWTSVFAVVENADVVQKYKHGLFPHWVYECRDASATVRLRRHVPMFTTSRDVARYDRLKSGLALYRLVFGQVNQEDLLDTLHENTSGLTPEARDSRLRRLSGYMLNLSPMTFERAMEHASLEAGELLSALPDTGPCRTLLADVERLRVAHDDALKESRLELTALTRWLDIALTGKDRGSARMRSVVAALCYLRNPYDGVFDHHGESGFADDVAVIKSAFRGLGRRKRLAWSV